MIDRDQNVRFIISHYFEIRDKTRLYLEIEGACLLRIRDLFVQIIQIPVFSLCFYQISISFLFFFESYFISWHSVLIVSPNYDSLFQKLSFCFAILERENQNFFNSRTSHTHKPNINMSHAFLDSFIFGLSFFFVLLLPSCDRICAPNGSF